MSLLTKETCPRCKGRKTPYAKTCRACSTKRQFTLPYLRWRKAVLDNDHYTCQACGVGFLSDGLESHHIRGYRQNPEVRYAVNNGIALCKEHHNQFHRLYGNFNNTWTQMREYLDGWELKRKVEADKISSPPS